MHHQHLEAGAAAGRRARMQEDPAIVMGLLPASSNRMGSHITHNCCAQHSCSEKLYSLRTGRHGGEREKRPSPPSHKCVQIGSCPGAYKGYMYRYVLREGDLARTPTRTRTCPRGQKVGVPPEGVIAVVREAVRPPHR